MNNIDKISETHFMYKVFLVLFIIVVLIVSGACQSLQAPGHDAPVPAPVYTPEATADPAQRPAPKQTPVPMVEATPEPTPEVVGYYAVVSNQYISINGDTVSFNVFEINGNLYLNLFELALAFSETEKQFFPEWVSEYSTILLTSNTPYTADDYFISHMSFENLMVSPANISTFFDGNSVSVSSFIIKENVFFELNDIAEILRLIIRIDTERGVIKIYTNYLLADRMERINNIDPSRPMIALTYDDGPHNIRTTAILDIMEEHGVVATFFVLGSEVERNPDVLLRAFNMGSEISNHTWSHPWANRSSAETLRNQLQRTHDIILSTIGVPPVNMRPTYGNITDDLQSLAREFDYPLILWSIDASDYLEQSPAAIYDHIMERVQDRDIILLHDIHDRTVEASRRLIPSLIEQGYQFVTISELFYFSNITPSPGERYRHGR